MINENNEFNYKNVENRIMSGGKKQVRKVVIKKGKGYKSIIHIKDGKKISGTRKKLKTNEINMIQIGKFIPGLFNDCMCNKKKNKTVRRKQK